MHCSGVRLSAQHVLTAGHCLERQTPQTLRVYVGLGVESGILPAGTSTLGISKLTLHPAFRAHPSGHADLGLVTLEIAADPMTIKLAPSLRAEQRVLLSHTQDTIQIVGFGQREDRGLGRKFAAATRTISFNAHEAVIGGGGRDSCSGDSGGGAYALSATSGRFLLGIISRGLQTTCGTGGYISLAADHRCWLEQTTGMSWGCVIPADSEQTENIRSFSEACRQPRRLSPAQRETLAALLARFTGRCTGTAKVLATAKKLDLSQLRLSDLSILGDLPELESLNLAGNHLTDAQLLQSIQRWPRLQQLYVAGNDLTSAAFVALKARQIRSYGEHLQVKTFTQTKFLLLCQQGQVPRDTLIAAIMYVTQSESCAEANLKLLDSATLELSGFNINSLAALENLETLRRLDLSYNPIESVAALASVENLQYLNIIATPLNAAADTPEQATMLIFEPLSGLIERGLLIDRGE